MTPRQEVEARKRRAAPAGGPRRSNGAEAPVAAKAPGGSARPEGTRKAGRLLPTEPPAPSSHAFEAIDRALHANLARLTLGLSPIVLARAYLDWLVHLAFAPGKQAQLGDKALRKAIRFALYAARAAVDRETPPCIEPLPQDHRFDERGLAALAVQSDLAESSCSTQQWWYNATTGSARHAQAASRTCSTFAGRQLLDIHGALELRPDQSRESCARPSSRAGEPRARRAEFRRGLGARDLGQAGRSAPRRSWSARRSPSRPARWSSATS